MKETIIILLLVFCYVFAYSQEELVTKDGRTVILNPNGTWKYKEIESFDIELVTVEGGLFIMGCKDDACNEDEKPLHKATLKTFSMGKYEVKVSEYKVFCEQSGHAMPKVPDWGWNDNHPIVNVSYFDAVAFCEWLSKKKGENYRLPTEAEWEFAARGGKKSKDYAFSGSNDVNTVAVYIKNAKSVEMVGSKLANELGIYDMSGNAYEWCSDWYLKTYYKDAPMGNPTGATEGSFRVIRGGCWSCEASKCRVAQRYNRVPDFTYYGLGFRVVKE